MHQFIAGPDSGARFHSANSSHIQPFPRPSILGKLLVNDVHADAIPGPLQLGVEVPEFLDVLHLLLQVVALKEVAELRVLVRLGNLVKLNKRAVDGLLQFKGAFNGLKSAGPLGLGGLGHVLEDNTPTTHVLVVDEGQGVVALLAAALLEELGETGHGLVVPVEERGL